MVSAILLSWNRVDNLLRLLDEYNQYEIIDEIIVFNNNPNYDLKSRISIIDPTIILIQANKDLGMNTRFSAAGLSTNKCILYLDDDILVPESTVGELYSKWIVAPNSCHGTHGRSISGGYLPIDKFGQVKIVLTRCLMTSKKNCICALLLALEFEHLHSIPKGNGEDIILSYASILLSGTLNRTYELSTLELLGGKCKKDSIHQRWPNHYSHRQKIVNLCEELLKQKKYSLKKGIWENMRKYIPILEIV